MARIPTMRWAGPSLAVLVLVGEGLLLGKGASPVCAVPAGSTSIWGRLVDPAGRPVGESMHIRVTETESISRTLLHAFSRSDGTFEVRGLDPGEYEILVEAPDDEAGPFPTRVVKPVMAGTEDLVIVLRRGAAVTGRIVDESGGAVLRKVEIRMERAGWTGADEDALEDADLIWSGAGGRALFWSKTDGTFESPALPEGTVWDLYAETTRGTFRPSPHEATWTLGGVARSVTAGTTDLVVALRNGGTISGRVLDAGGAPVGEGERVVAEANPRTDEPGELATAFTASDGTFTLRGLGEFRFTVTVPAMGALDPEARASERHVPGSRGLALRVRNTAVLSGKLLEADGTAAAVLLLLARDSAGNGLDACWEFGEGGAFRLRHLPVGRIHLFAAGVSGFDEAKDSRGEVALGAFDAPSTGLEVRLKARKR